MDQVLRSPGSTAPGHRVERGTQVYFDGSARGREGSGGYLVWGHTGLLLEAAGLWYGVGEPTNNTAELRALVDALAFVHGHVPTTSHVFVHGDSKLAVDFCRRVARPSRPELFVSLR